MGEHTPMGAYSNLASFASSSSIPTVQRRNSNERTHDGVFGTSFFSLALHADLKKGSSLSPGCEASSGQEEDQKEVSHGILKHAEPIDGPLKQFVADHVVMALLVLVATRGRLSYERYRSQIELPATEAVVGQEPETVDRSA